MKSALGRSPVSLMKLVEIDGILEAVSDMEACGLTEDDLMIEHKFNGWHVQVVDDRIWSRRGKSDLTLKFPEIARQVKRFRRDHLIGELIYWGPAGMEEPAVTTVAGTKDIGEALEKIEMLPGTFQIVLFDVLAIDLEDLTEASTQHRREELEGLVGRQTWELALSPVDEFRHWRAVYEENVSLGGDGVVLKNRLAPYIWRPLGKHEASPMGTRYKLKPTKTDDFVVAGAHPGPKGKLVLELAQYHDEEFVPVSEMSNLSREDEAEFKARLKRGPFVVEVEFQSRFLDPPGALQHPRLTRVREDKDPEDIVLPERYAP